MGQTRDTLCRISGFPHFDKLSDVVDTTDDWIDEIEWSDDEDPEHLDVYALDKWFNQYTEEDEQDSKIFAYIAPFDENDEELHTTYSTTFETLSALSRKVCAVPNLTPEMSHWRPPGSSQRYKSTTTGQIYSIGLSYDVPCLLVHASALRILALAAPHLTIGRLWMLDHIVRNQYAYPYNTIDKMWSPSQVLKLNWEEDDPKYGDWVREVVRRGTTTAEDMKEMMFGRGHLYMLVRPDVFPVAQAFVLSRQSGLAQLAREVSEHIAADPPAPNTLPGLPLDILLLLSSRLPLSSIVTLCTSCGSLLCALGPHLDAAVHASMKLHEPWHLPPPAGMFPEGHDQKWFEEQSAAAAQDELQPFPWLAYARACRESASMKNRRRLWNVSIELERMAVEFGILGK
ncbi:hypothetical protein A0H81_10510 [Grifola frondosa]|uniref:Uncharacterized protein n=1 Tax=Grifola frondosa TaxID=5627 RepID=A0A1C7LXW3_GRIFR|nr:hypothetical protein A0H81_10510 [Grifola frondosa]